MTLIIADLITGFDLSSLGNVLKMLCNWLLTWRGVLPKTFWQLFSFWHLLVTFSVWKIIYGKCFPHLSKKITEKKLFFQTNFIKTILKWEYSKQIIYFKCKKAWISPFL